MTLHYIENAFFIEALTGFQEKEKKRLHRNYTQ